MAVAIQFDGTDLTIGSNGFSTTNRYIRQVANSADGMMWMVEGPHMKIQYYSPGGGVTWRYESGDLSYVFPGYSPYNDANAPSAGFSTSRLIAT